MTLSSRHVLILTADTGGGHRSASEALAEALAEQGQPNCAVVDVFRYVPRLFHRAPRLYRPTITYAAPLYALMYRVTQGRRSSRMLISAWMSPLSRRGLRRLYHDHAPGLVISSHPLFQHVASSVLRSHDPTVPFVTLVTDLASAHRVWFTPLTDLCLVPTERVRQTALSHGLQNAKICVTGLPVHRAFVQSREVSRAEARELLGLSEQPTVLIVGGGEGMGNLEAIALAAERASPQPQLLVVAGRNHRLYQRLHMRQWAAPVRVFGFVRNLSPLMRAADLIITKAGPSTLSEALVCGLPILMSGYVPGQEEGNVAYIIEHGAGRYLSEPATQLASVLSGLLGDGGSALADIARRAVALGRPEAARDAAALVATISHRQALRPTMA